jgi:hypothetical protein
VVRADGRLSYRPDSLNRVDDHSLYRYFDSDGAGLYNGRSNDWIRRLREHRLISSSNAIREAVVQWEPLSTALPLTAT